MRTSSVKWVPAIPTRYQFPDSSGSHTAYMPVRYVPDAFSERTLRTCSDDLHAIRYCSYSQETEASGTPSVTMAAKTETALLSRLSMQMICSMPLNVLFVTTMTNPPGRLSSKELCPAISVGHPLRIPTSRSTRNSRIMNKTKAAFKAAFLRYISSSLSRTENSMSCWRSSCSNLAFSLRPTSRSAA